MVAFTPALGIGAAIGAYTQDPLDHPIAALGGAAIGGYAASVMSYHDYIKPVARVSKGVSIFDQAPNINFGEKISDRLAEIESRLHGYYVGVTAANPEYAERQAEALNNYERLLKVKAANIDAVMSNQFGLSIMNGYSLDDPAGLSSLKAFVNSQESGSAALKMLHSTMNFDTSITIADMKVSAHLQKTPGFKISAMTSAAEAENLIREHLINQLGHGGQLKETAAMKAKVLSQALAGFEYSVDDGLNITANGRVQNIPLTAYDKNGVRYSKVGDIRYGVLPMNPFAGNYLDKKSVGSVGAMLLGSDRVPIAADVLKQYDPELLLGFTDLKSGNPLRALFNIASKIKSHSEYLSIEAHGESVRSGKRERLSSQVYAGYRIHDGRIGEISMVSNRKGRMPEARQLSQMLVEDSGSNIFSGVNVNALKTYNAGDNKFYYAGLFPTMERGADTVLDRGYESAGGSKEELAKLIGVSESALSGKEFAGMSNAVLFNRMDVDDSLSKMASDLFGAHISLDDGAGLFNEASKEKFSVVQNVTMDIAPIAGTNKFMLNGQFSRIQELAAGATIDTPMSIKGNDVLGFDGLGNEVRLGKEFTHGEIVDAYVDNGKLKVSVRAKYEPKDWVKIFSTATKSGLTKLGGKEFDALVKIEMLRRDRAIEIDNTNTSIRFIAGEYKGQTWDTRRILSEVHNENGFFKNLPDMKVDILSRVDDTGTEMLAAARDGVIPKLNKFKDRFGDVDGVIKTAVDNLTSESVKERIASAKFLMAVSDIKSNSDMFFTGIDEALANNDIEGANVIRNAAYNRSNIMSKGKIERNKALREIYNVFRRNADEYNDVVKTTATMDLGESIRGAGNAGRISWLEQLNLKNNGWTADDLKAIGVNNSDALYELSMVESRVNRGQNLMDKKIQYGQRISGLFDKTGSARLEELSLMGIKDEGKGFLSYGLTMDHEGVKSIGISLRDTNISGMLDIDGKELMKSMDQAKQRVVMADINLANELKNKGSDSYNKALDEFKSAMNSLNVLTNKMFKGDNNLMKNALRLESDVAVIHNLRSAEGDLGAFSEYRMRQTGKLQSIVGFSKQGFNEFAERVGLEGFSYEKVEGFDNLLKVKHKNADYLAMLTREPAQGPLSSYAAEVYIDTSIKGNVNHAFIPKAKVGDLKSIAAMYQFADFDADSGRVTSLHKLSEESRRRIISTQNAMIDTASTIASLQQAMGSKGQEFNIVTLADFKSSKDFELHLAASGGKSKIRKMLAPFATDIAVNMNAALDKHLQSLNLGQDELIKRSMTGRSVIHNLVETLLKTQHKKTDPATMGAIAEMENLLHAHEDLLTGGDKKLYKARSKSVFDAMLGVKVNKDGVSNETKAAYSSAVDDITSAVSKYARVIDMEGWEQKHGRFGTAGSAAQLDNYIKAVSSKGMLPHEISDSIETTIRSFTDNAKGYFEYAKNIASDNKRIIGLAALGLGATAAFIGSERPELSKETLPVKDKNAILQPIPDEKGYVTKGRDYRASGKTFNVQASNNNGNPRQKTRELFQDKSRSNVIIKDKRER